MSDVAPQEPTYGAGEDIPGTPAPFPFGLVSLGFAFVSMLIASNWFFIGGSGFTGWPFYVGACLAWLGTGIRAIVQGRWKGPAAGLALILLPWLALAFLIIDGLSSFQNH